MVGASVDIFGRNFGDYSLETGGWVSGIEMQRISLRRQKKMGIGFLYSGKGK